MYPDTLREEPFRLLFPLGALLAVAGVVPWLLYWLGAEKRWLGAEHALVQLEGFLPCLAAGFLFTMLPRRTRTAPAGPVPFALATLGFTIAAVAGLRDAWLVAHVAYGLGIVGLLSYSLAAQWRPEGRRTPDAFVLLAIGLGQGLLGAILLAGFVTDQLGRKSMLLGRLLVEEGVFLTLMLGVGAFVVPHFTGHEAPPDSESTSASRLRRIGHALFALALLVSFVLEVAIGDVVSPLKGTRVGYAMRFLLVLGYLLFVVKIWRRPIRTGTARRLIWIAYWLLPISLACVAAMPEKRVGFRHLLLAGAYSLAVLAVAAHVTYGHCGRHDLRDGRSWALRVVGALLILAAITRVSADFLMKSYVPHLGSASLLWLLALLIWVATLAPLWLRGAPKTSAEPAS